jgi:exonuclease VII small subunit
MPARAFAEIRADLEEIVTRLEHVSDPDRRRELLREMHALLQEADLTLNSLVCDK